MAGTVYVKTRALYAFLRAHGAAPYISQSIFCSNGGPGRKRLQIQWRFPRTNRVVELVDAWNSDPRTRSFLIAFAAAAEAYRLAHLEADIDAAREEAREKRARVARRDATRRKDAP